MLLLNIGKVLERWRFDLITSQLGICQRPRDVCLFSFLLGVKDWPVKGKMFDMLLLR